ncbi:zinc finger, CCHC-type containing protein [Tanacetum coccineum]|uniref:Zinc finger, CCHC-type containing protein n=1 Tax=Tanacetum coccineum TaxID=301880 RepID=A0ABQ4XSL4_9ASTR
MAAAAKKHMASSFAKLEKFEGVDFRRWQKKMHFMLFRMSAVYVLTTPMPDDGDTLEAKYMAEDASSKKFLVSNFTNYKMTDSRPVLEQYNELLGILGRFTQHNMNLDESIKVSYIIDKLPPSWKDFKHTLKHLKEELTLIELGSHLRIEESIRAQDNNKPKGNNVAGHSVVNMVEHNNSSRYNDNKGKRKHHDTRANPNKKSKVTCWKCGKPRHLKKDCKGGNVGNRANDDDVAWWVDSGATVHVCKDRCWFKTYESLNDGSILHMGNESTAFVHRRGCVDLRLNIVSDNIGSAFMSTSKLNDSILWHARLCHVHFKRLQDMSKDGLIPAFDMDTKKCQTCMLNKITKKPFQNVKCKTKVLELIHSNLYDLHATSSLGNKKYFVTFIMMPLGLIGENRVVKEMVNSMLSNSGLSQGFWGEAMPVVRLPDLKLKTLGEKGIECIFVRYAEHSKAFRFYVIEPNDSVAINSIIESRDAIFDENMFSFIPRLSQRSLVKGTVDSGGSVVSERVTNEIDDPKIFDEAMKSQDVAFWKEAIADEMDSIMGNNTWVLTDLPPGCRPLGYKWIFKRKLKVDGTVEKFKARLVIQGFKQKSRIYCFDTYALVARISTIILLIALASIYSLIIHKIDVKIAFLNGELEEEVYMNQPLGFILPDNENKVCKLIKSLYGIKHAPKQWYQKFNEVVLSNGYILNQADKCVYSKFDASGKGVIICLYVNDMLIFGTDQVYVDLTKEFLSPSFYIKDMGEADVILGIRIKHESNGIAISQYHCIEKVLKKFNYSDCTPVSTPMDTCEKLMPNRGLAVSQLEYSK